jgi:hypothetical protein
VRDIPSIIPGVGVITSRNPRKESHLIVMDGRFSLLQQMYINNTTAEEPSPFQGPSLRIPELPPWFNGTGVEIKLAKISLSMFL